MAFTCGFFNSQNGDRKYNAEQMASIFDGLIKDGVYDTVGDIFAVTPGTGMQVLVGSGRAWFDHTWNNNDAQYPLAITAADVSLPRYDAVVLETNHSDTVRTNRLRVLTGTPASNPVKPTMASTANVKQHPLAYIKVTAGATAITQSMIQVVVGTSECPFVTGIIDTAQIDALFQQWNGEFNEWFENLKAQLSDNVVANLQGQIDQKVAKADVATTADIEAGTSTTKWVSPKGLKDAGIDGSLGQIGTIINTKRNEINNKWILCNGEPYDVDEYPKLRAIDSLNHHTDSGPFIPYTNLPSHAASIKKIINLKGWYTIHSNNNVKYITLYKFDENGNMSAIESESPTNSTSISDTCVIFIHDRFYLFDGGMTYTTSNWKVWTTLNISSSPDSKSWYVECINGTYYRNKYIFIAQKYDSNYEGRHIVVYVSTDGLNFSYYKPNNYYGGSEDRSIYIIQTDNKLGYIYMANNNLVMQAASIIYENDNMVYPNNKIIQIASVAWSVQSIATEFMWSDAENIYFIDPEKISFGRLRYFSKSKFDSISSGSIGSLSFKNFKDINSMYTGGSVKRMLDNGYFLSMNGDMVWKVDNQLTLRKVIDTESSTIGNFIGNEKSSMYYLNSDSSLKYVFISAYNMLPSNNQPYNVFVKAKE